VRREITDTEGQWGISNEKKEEKLKQLVVNYDELSNYQEQCNGFDQGFLCCKIVFKKNWVFWNFGTVGTTRADAGGAEGFKKVDYTYTMEAMKLMKNGGVKHAHLLTAQGSKANSWFLYPQVKGQVEEETKALNFDKLSIYRPGLLYRDNPRFVETVFATITPSNLDFLLSLPYLNCNFLTCRSIQYALCNSWWGYGEECRCKSGEGQLWKTRSSREWWHLEFVRETQLTVFQDLIVPKMYNL
jgi:hypothetical protein